MNEITGKAKLDAAGVEITLRIPASGAESSDERAERMASKATQKRRDMAEISHSPDYSAVVWYGTRYAFSLRQRLVVAALFEAEERGYRWVMQETLLEIAESDGTRLRDLFRAHPAWGVMIVSGVGQEGGQAGAYGLGWR
jgi:hypothetical protein